MYDNAIKCIESDYPTVLGLAQVLGAITMDEQTVVPAKGVIWDYIGYKRVGAEPAEGQADNRPYLQDGLGNKYVHVNVRTPFSVGAKAAKLALAIPEIAGALMDTGRYFVVDGFGQSVFPEVPMRVFA